MSYQQRVELGGIYVPKRGKPKMKLPIPRDPNHPDVRYCHFCTGEHHSVFFSKSTQYFGCECRLFCNICMRTIYRKSHRTVLRVCSAKTPDGQVLGCNAER